AEGAVEEDVLRLLAAVGGAPGAALGHDLVGEGAARLDDGALLPGDLQRHDDVLAGAHLEVADELLARRIAAELDGEFPGGAGEGERQALVVDEAAERADVEPLAPGAGRDRLGRELRRGAAVVGLVVAAAEDGELRRRGGAVAEAGVELGGGE